MPFDPNSISQGLATGASIPNRNTGLSELIRTITKDLTNAKAERIKNQQKTTDQRIELLKTALAGGYQGDINSFMQTGDLSAFKTSPGVTPPASYQPTYKVNEYGRTMLSGYEQPSATEQKQQLHNIGSQYSGFSNLFGEGAKKQKEFRKQFVPQQYLPTTPTQQNGIPQVGQTFNGEVVTNIRKIE